MLQEFIWEARHIGVGDVRRPGGTLSLKYFTVTIHTTIYDSKELAALLIVLVVCISPVTIKRQETQQSHTMTDGPDRPIWDICNLVDGYKMRGKKKKQSLLRC